MGFLFYKNAIYLKKKKEGDSMAITGAFILFGIFILGYMVIAEAFTVLFRLTGLTNEKARFQVISMLTNSGYTTAESELITSSKKRRRLARVTMLFGYSFTVTIVSVIVNIFIALPQAQLQNIWQITCVIAIGVVGVYILLKYTGIRKSFDHFIENLGNKFMFGDAANPMMVLDYYGENVMVEIHVNHVPSILRDTPLEKSVLKSTYQLQVVLIKREGEMIANITGDTIIQEDDELFMFGNYKTIRMLFEKPLS